MSHCHGLAGRLGRTRTGAPHPTRSAGKARTACPTSSPGPAQFSPASPLSLPPDERWLGRSTGRDELGDLSRPLTLTLSRDALDLATGKAVWNFPANASGVIGSPAVEGGMVVFGSRDGRVYALN